MNADTWPDDEVAAAVRSLTPQALEDWRRYAQGPGRGMGPAQLSEIFHARYLRDPAEFICYSCGQRAVEHTPERTGRCISRWIIHVMQHSPGGGPATRTAPVATADERAVADLWRAIHAKEATGRASRRNAGAAVYKVSTDPAPPTRKRLVYDLDEKPPSQPRAKSVYDVDLPAKAKPRRTSPYDVEVK
jgi:hypothetical protein